MNLDELNDFTKYEKFSSPFVKDDRFLNTAILSQALPKGKWILTEKINGSNIRIILTKPNDDGEIEVHIGSRKLILNPDDKGSKVFFDCLDEVNLNKLRKYFKDVNSTIVIYGEGYGSGIQKGSIYSHKKNFRVFDIRIGQAYQDWSFVEKVCVDNQLSLVPVYNIVDIISYDGCVSHLNYFQETLIKEGDGGRPEGLVYKFEPVLLNKYKERLLFKVKFEDFEKEI